LFMVIAQTIPFGTLMLPLGIFTPISGAAPAGSVAIGSVVIRLSGRRVHGCGCIVTRAVAAADPDGKTGLRKRRGAREKHKSDQNFRFHEWFPPAIYRAPWGPTRNFRTFNNADSLQAGRVAGAHHRGGCFQPTVSD